MSGRRTSLPGADELFRSTSPLSPTPLGSSPALAPVAAPMAAEPATSTPETAPVPADDADTRRRGRGARRPTGRERHEEKITVYVSADELIDLERSRLTLRTDHGVVVDRGRIVREALSMTLEDLEAKGDASALVRRLRNR